MPGIKRKSAQPARASTSKKTSGAVLNGRSRSVKETPGKVDDFDDDEDLMAAALASGGSAEEASDGGEDDDEDGRDRDVEMFSDEDLEGGFEDVATGEADAGPSSQKKPEGHRSLYAIPSRGEMSSLKNTSELYKSNIFKLKVEEMVSEVRPKYEKSDSLDFVLRRIKQTLESLPSLEPQPLLPALDALRKTFHSQKLRVPFPDPQPKEDSPLKFAFEKPSRVQVVGSWILKAASLRPEGVDVDLVLTMPSTLFQEKDHLNMRYFHKRAFYLGAIGAALASESELGIQCHYALQEDDARRPYLLLRAEKSGSQSDFTKLKAFIKVHLAHDHDVFAARRLGPLRNNIRMEGFDEADQPATPSYNASVLVDSLYTPHLLYLNATSQASASFAEACVLLKTWSLQRVFGSGPSKAEIKGRVGGEKGRRIGLGSSGARFLLSMLLAHLLNGSERTSGGGPTSRLSPGFSSYQLFKGTIDFLSSHDFVAQPVVMKNIDGVLSRRDKIDPDEFSRPDKAILIDPTGSINLLENMDSGTLAMLQSEARLTRALLNDAEEDHFDEIFLRDRSKPSFALDETMQVSLKGIKANAVSIADGGSSLRAAAQDVLQTLATALNTRAGLLVVFGPSTTHWPLTSARPKLVHKVEVGVMYHPSQAFRLVDHGPRPEDQHASDAFKSFWGDMAELRRFRDGRVVESVVWSAHGPMDRIAIPKSIIRYSLQRRHGITADQVSFFSDTFQGLLVPNEQLAKEAYLALPSDAGFQTVQSAFDEVVKTLRGLDGLPLSLISIVGADAALRAMSIMVPPPVNLHASLPGSASFMPAHDFVITLESSGRWPDDLLAIQGMKMAFYETMAAKVTKSLTSCRTAVVVDTDAEENRFWDCTALEIILSSGMAFRGRIYHERERVLLKRILEDKDEENHVKSQAKMALERFECRFDHNVRHHGHMAALSHRFVSLAEAVRLLKRWVSSQMLAMDVSDQLCELVVASVYIQASEGGDPPTTGHSGFARALLRLSEWDWRQEPLIVAMTGATSSTPVCSLKGEAKQTVQANFEQVRKQDPGLNHFPWFIATESELGGSAWAKRHPTAGTADALQRLARGACDILAAGPNLGRAAVKSLFLPSLAHFDFLIRLEPAVVNRFLDNIDFNDVALDQSLARVGNGKASKAKYRNLPAPTTGAVLAGLDVGSEFVRLIESLYLDSMRLYYDGVGGTVIGGLFNPLLAKPRPFRVGLGFNSKPADATTTDVVLNHTDVVAEIERLGRGVVQRVEWCKQVSM